MCHNKNRVITCTIVHLCNFINEPHIYVYYYKLTYANKNIFIFLKINKKQIYRKEKQQKIPYAVTIFRNSFVGNFTSLSQPLFSRVIYI